jgi:fructan beta-fructosidase
VLAYTSTGRGECIAYSTDKGRTWKEYDKNPVVKHTGRDPKLVWYEKGKHWVMAVYTEADKKQWIAFHTSPDLKEWKFASRIEGFFECPDLFELPVFDERQNLVGRKWVLYAADGKYLTGDFDGKVYKPDSSEKKQLWYGRFYAAQTFDSETEPRVVYGPVNTPLPALPRRVQIGWAQGVTFPGMPFNQQMTVPVELSLRASGLKSGPLLAAEPVPEVQGLHEEKPVVDFLHSPGHAKPAVLADNLDAFAVSVWIDPGKATGFTLNLRGTILTYDGAKKTLSCKDVTAPVELDKNVLRLQILVDRGSVEVFADNGRVAMSIAAILDEKNRKVELSPRGGAVTITEGTIYRMKSAWEK